MRNVWSWGRKRINPQNLTLMTNPSKSQNQVNDDNNFLCIKNSVFPIY